MAKIDKYNRNFIILTILLFITLAAAELYMFINSTYTTLFLKILFTTFSTILLGWFIYSYKMKNIRTYRLLIVGIVAFAVLLFTYVILTKYNFISFFDSMDDIKNFVLSTGMWGQLVYFLIQFIQVSFIPIPYLITTLAGVAIFGPFITSVLSSVAVIVGSLFSFFIWGRVFGRKLVVWIAGEELTDKYSTLLDKKGRYLLPFMFLFPFFPDDIFCMIAGITKMKALYFIAVTLITRPITCFFFSYFTGGTIIPYSGWGLIAWPIIIIAMAVVFIWVYKNDSKIEDYFLKKFNRFEKHKNKEKLVVDENNEDNKKPLN
ncbi:MAG: TVP38/TMEM64 family protein [Spirochaetales bacterium]